MELQECSFIESRSSPTLRSFNSRVNNVGELNPILTSSESKRSSD